MTGVDIIVTRTAIGNGAPRVETIGDVLDLQVNPIDRDNRSQAERNADNAIKAARLERVEAELEQAVKGIRGLVAMGATKVSAELVLQGLQKALAAPISSGG